VTLLTLSGKPAGPGDLAVCGCLGSAGVGRCWVQENGSHLDGDACLCAIRLHPRCPVDAHRAFPPDEWLLGRYHFKRQAGISLRNDIPEQGRSVAGSRAERQEHRPFQKRERTFTFKEADRTPVVGR
jgi:hypothetical protein